MDKKRKKAKEEQAKTKPAKPVRGLTRHGKRVLDFMEGSKIKGNFRDYVLFVGDQMIDAWGQYTIRRQASEAAAVALVHKRELHKIIGTDNAQRFWHQKLGKRTSHGAPRSRHVQDAS